MQEVCIEKETYLQYVTWKSGYAYRLMDYIYEKEAGTFEVQAFTNVKNLSAFAREQEIELLLISSSAMCEAVKELPIRRIVILIRRRDSAGACPIIPACISTRLRTVWFREVMTYYARCRKPSEPAVSAEKESRDHRDLFAGKADTADLFCADPGAAPWQRTKCFVSEF